MIEDATKLSSMLWQAYPYACLSYREFVAVVSQQQALVDLMNRAVGFYDEHARQSGSSLNPIGALRDVLSDFYSYHTCGTYGNNLFDLRGDLAQALLLTDPPLNIIKLPYPGIMVRVPDGCVPVFSSGVEPRWATIIFATEDEDRIVLRSTSTSSMLTTQQAYNRVTHAPFIGVTIPASTDAREQILDEDALTGLAAFRIVANLTSWLSGHPAKREKTHRASTAKRHSKHCWPTVWVTGGAVSLPKSLREAAAEYAMSGSSASKPGWKLRMQSIVRGHWKQQAHGPQNALRKLIWVEPYLRGPDAQVAWAHVYQPPKSSQTDA